jgi:hypothetical protein
MHRLKILLRIVFDLLGHDRLDDERRACQQQRVAVGRRGRRRFGADGRAAAGFVIDHDSLAELALQVLRQQPRHHVIRRPRRVGHDDADRLLRKTVGRRVLADERKTGDGDNTRESSSR